MSDLEQNNYQGRPLTDELASSRNIRLTGEIDIRKSTVLERKLVVPLATLSILAKKDKAVENFVDGIAHWLISVDGRGRRDLVRGEQVRKGIASNPDSEMPQRPGLFSRINPFDAQAHEQEKEYQQYKKEVGV